MTDEQRPWREDPMFSEVDGGAWDRLDALCARVWREAQVQADLTCPAAIHAQKAIARADAAEAQRDRLAAAAQQTIDGIASEHPQCDITNTARCYCGRVTAPLRAALADVREDV